jgi:hypothetical protein
LERLNNLNSDEDDDNFIDDSEVMDYIKNPVTEEGLFENVQKESMDTDIIEDNEAAAFANWASIGFQWAEEYFETSGKKFRSTQIFVF